MGDHADRTWADHNDRREDASGDGYVDFLLSTGAMKNLPRAGWRLAGIKDCESVADHAFRVALLALVLGDLVEGVDREKLLRMALLHELPESIVTDLPLRAVMLLGRDTKHRAERDAWSLMLPPGQIRQEWRALWDEFEAGQTPEARLVKAADKLEMLLQAYEYERVGYRNLDDFWEKMDLADSEFEPVRAILTDLLQRRQVITGVQNGSGI